MCIRVYILEILGYTLECALEYVLECIRVILECVLCIVAI